MEDGAINGPCVWSVGLLWSVNWRGQALLELQPMQAVSNHWTGLQRCLQNLCNRVILVVKAKLFKSPP